MSKVFYVQINMGNAAMLQNEDVIVALKKMCKDISANDLITDWMDPNVVASNRVVYDLNGQAVGIWGIKEQKDGT